MKRLTSIILRSIKKALLEPSIEDISRAGVLAKFPRIRDRNSSVSTKES